MQRRIFIKNTCLACLGGGAAGMLAQGCAAQHFVGNGIENGRVSLKKSEFVFLKKGKETLRQWVLVKVDGLPFPIGVFRFDDDRYAACYLECTHQQCELSPEGDYLQCPCHGSEFSNTGEVQRGPAEAGLKAFRTTSDALNIFIHLA